jgi:hypothetical protein
MQRLSHLYESVDALSAKYGKYTLFLAASLPAHLHAQHASNRTLLPGETRRKRLGIPCFWGRSASDRRVLERDARGQGALGIALDPEGDDVGKTSGRETCENRSPVRHALKRNALRAPHVTCDNLSLPGWPSYRVAVTRCHMRL